MKYNAKSQRPISRQIGPQLKAQRLARNMTLEEVAEKSKLTVAAIYRMENGLTCSASNSYEAVAEAIGVSYGVVVHQAELASLKEKEAGKEEPKAGGEPPAN